MPPARSCIACRRKASPAELLRLVADARGVVRPDTGARSAGRGAWLHPHRDCVETLLKRPAALSRALRRPVVVDQLDDAIHAASIAGLERALSTAARSGCVVSGRQTIERQLQRDELVALVVAADAAPRSVAHLSSGAPGLPLHTVGFDRRALGQRVHKGPRAALGVRAGTPSEALLVELRRYTALGYHPPRFRSGDRPEATRRTGTTQSRGRGLRSPSSPDSSHRKRGQPTVAALREGSECPRKNS